MIGCPSQTCRYPIGGYVESAPAGYVSDTMVREGELSTPLSDNPVSSINSDLFGIRSYVEELHDLVSRADSLPLTVGVFGSWGAGKSSFLRMWQNLLTGAPEDRTVWFNPWKYDQKVEVWAALLQSLLAEVSNEQERSGERVAAMARAVSWLALRAGTGIAANWATNGIVPAADITSVLDAFTTQNRKHYAEINRFEADFAEAVNAVLPPEGRLFVFVDDLDRCTPEAAISVLEAMKLFIGDARCVFVLAMDLDRLSSIAANKFGTGGPADGTAYLEKIIQLPFHLPRIQLTAVQKVYGPALGALGEDPVLWNLIETGLGHNPRRIKRFINVLNLALSIRRRDTSVSPQPSRDQELQLATLLIVQSEFRATYHALAADPSLWSTASPDPLQTDAAYELMFHPKVPRPGPADVRRMLDAIRVSAP